MRSKTIDSLTSLADKYVHFNESDVPIFICDLVRSGKWQASFGTESAASNSAMSQISNSPDTRELSATGSGRRTEP